MCFGCTCRKDFVEQQRRVSFDGLSPKPDDLTVLPHSSWLKSGRRGTRVQLQIFSPESTLIRTVVKTVLVYHHMHEYSDANMHMSLKKQYRYIAWYAPWLGGVPEQVEDSGEQEAAGGTDGRRRLVLRIGAQRWFGLVSVLSPELEYCKRTFK